MGGVTVGVTREGVTEQAGSTNIPPAPPPPWAEGGSGVGPRSLGGKFPYFKCENLLPKLDKLPIGG